MNRGPWPKTSLALCLWILPATHFFGSDACAQSTTPAPPASQNAEQLNFFQRFFSAYANDWNGTAAGGPEPARRGFPAPESSPPFPFADWPYGGSPVLGAPDTNVPPLMQALYTGAHGKAWERSRIKIYGWVNGGFNVSTSDRHYGNAPASYFIVPNSIQMDQTALYVERVPDTVQHDHFDWGFRVTSLYGIDYRFTTAKGYLSQQLLERNHEYGYDPVMAYADLYWGQVAGGLNIRIGRYISLPDIEAQLAPDNYTYSHSILYTFDAYTQTGVNATLKLDDHWMFQLGLSAGNDVAPWVGAPDAKPTLNACVSYTWKAGRDNVYVCDNSQNSGKYAYNNVQSYYATWYHAIGKSWHTATESWYMWEKGVPNVNNPDAVSLLETNANGAICDSPEQLRCFAPEWAAVNYLEKEFSAKNYLTIRNEYFDDIRGQRTGFRTRYSEHLLGWGHWFGSTVLVRPEIRFERAYDQPAYDAGTKKNQFVLAGDLIYHF
jgi:Putative beta-barrel porin-2, OmpL-like. bbp2